MTRHLSSPYLKRASGAREAHRLWHAHSFLRGIPDDGMERHCARGRREENFGLKVEMGGRGGKKRIWRTWGYRQVGEQASKQAGVGGGEKNGAPIFSRDSPVVQTVEDCRMWRKYWTRVILRGTGHRAYSIPLHASRFTLHPSREKPIDCLGSSVGRIG